jgi:oxalate decarboxylase
VPPPTDHGVIEPFWYSFDLTQRRVQEGGWTDQVTTRELPVSKVAHINLKEADLDKLPTRGDPVLR